MVDHMIEPLGRTLRTMSQQQNAVSNRLAQQLQDLIQGQNWKQALSLCEKRIKKGDKSDQLLVRYLTFT